MAKWDFLELNSENEPVTLSEPNLKIVPWLEYTLAMATDSKVPNPKFSNYFVKCACLVVDKLTNSESFYYVVSVSGGNTEYGLCQALHGEESLVTAIRSALSKRGMDGNVDRYSVLIAFSSKFKSEVGRVPTCCGNCRDIMRDNLPLHTMIFAGHPEGGQVIVSRLSDMLVDEYGLNISSPGHSIRDMALGTIMTCHRLENDIYFPGEPHPRRKYYAAIIGEGTTFFGAHDVMCDYHPIYAIRDAVRQARRENKPQFQYVIVAGKGDGSGLPPDVMYKDRQHLLELNFQQECLSGIITDPPVLLVSYELDGRLPGISKYWETSVKRWLPYAFSPAAFGDEFVRYATDKFKEK